MAIELLRVTKDLRSVLGLSGYQLEDYRKCLEVIKWLDEKEGKKTVPEKIKDGGIKELKSTFVKIVSEYLGKIGLEILGTRAYFRPDHIMDVHCQGIKIIMDRENYLDGFEPELKFFINPEIPLEIEVACQLRQNGMTLLSYLIKPTLLHYLPTQNNGLDLPLVKMVKEEDLITIASIEQISSFLRDMKIVAQFIGTEKLAQLEKATEAFVLAPPELKEAAKGIYALTFLKILGKEI